MADRELDLHGYKWDEAKKAFMHAYNESFDSDGKPLVRTIDIIHGYGSTGKGGVLRTRLRRFLVELTDYLKFIPGERLGSNLGHTIVYPSSLLPQDEAVLMDRIRRVKAGAVESRKRRNAYQMTSPPEADMLAYCSKPRTLTQIDRRMGKRIVLEEIDRILRALVAQGKLVETRKGDEEAYVQTSPES